MSAAALSAHGTSSEPDSRQSRRVRGRIADILISGTSCLAEMRRFRARSKHRLPCEP